MVQESNHYATKIVDGQNKTKGMVTMDPLGCRGIEYISRYIHICYFTSTIWIPHDGKRVLCGMKDPI